MTTSALLLTMTELGASATGVLAQATSVATNAPGEVGAYRPFIDPIDAQPFWFALLIPLAIGIAVAYKAVRMTDMQGYARQVAVMSLQIVLGMIALAIGFYLFVLVYLPWVSGGN